MLLTIDNLQFFQLTPASMDKGELLMALMECAVSAWQKHNLLSLPSLAGKATLDVICT